MSPFSLGWYREDAGTLGRPCQMKRLSADTIVLSASSAGVSWQIRDRLVGGGIHDTGGYGKRAPSPAS